MLTQEFVEMAEELRLILGSINGAQKVEEACLLSYMVHVKDESDKYNVEQVANALVEQAEQKGIAIEILAVTQKDIDDAREKLASLMEKN